MMKLCIEGKGEVTVARQRVPKTMVDDHMDDHAVLTRELRWAPSVAFP